MKAICIASLQTDRGVHARLATLRVVEPARRSRSWSGCRTAPTCLPYGPRSPSFEPREPVKLKNRHRHRDGHVDAHLPDIDLVLELARRRAALREDTAVPLPKGLSLTSSIASSRRVDADDHHHRPEDFSGVDAHVGLHAGEDRRSDEIALLVARHLDGAAVEVELRAGVDAFLDQSEDAVLGVLGDHRTRGPRPSRRRR